MESLYCLSQANQDEASTFQAFPMVGLCEALATEMNVNQTSEAARLIKPRQWGTWRRCCFVLGKTETISWGWRMRWPLEMAMREVMPKGSAEMLD